MRVLGIDPSLQSTGFGVVDEDAGRLSPVAYGVIKPIAKQALHLKLESLFPEPQVKNFALAREKIILYVDARHGFQVRLNNAHGYMLGQFRGRITACFHSLKRQAAEFLIFFGLPVEIGHARINIPAVIVEPAAHRGHFLQGFSLHPFQPDNDIRHLNSCIIQVILHLNLMAQKAKAAHEGITQRGIAQMPDMGGLVGIDIRVLDNGFARFPRFRCPAEFLLLDAFGQLQSEGITGKMEI